MNLPFPSPAGGAPDAPGTAWSLYDQWFPDEPEAEAEAVEPRPPDPVSIAEQQRACFKEKLRAARHRLDVLEHGDAATPRPLLSRLLRQSARLPERLQRLHRMEVKVEELLGQERLSAIEQELLRRSLAHHAAACQALERLCRDEPVAFAERLNREHALLERHRRLNPVMSASSAPRSPHQDAINDVLFELDKASTLPLFDIWLQALKRLVEETSPGPTAISARARLSLRQQAQPYPAARKAPQPGPSDPADRAPAGAPHASRR
ncbi:hypothetical protein [Mitsuaria sp. GD03876]|uniref:hypothetical protein n=1 Tax=Mitsuaria sp. GD03876 TaxID=2975399 RepID=UPI00244BF146|nr:hypothetical protein [Mitsuaria sp. GD03876]MDH0863561.1 hypothetical protein [Mitsuaria sp. GD03876]